MFESNILRLRLTTRMRKESIMFFKSSEIEIKIVEQKITTVLNYEVYKL